MDGVECLWIFDANKVLVENGNFRMKYNIYKTKVKLN